MPGSGNGNGKGDVATPRFLVECKETGQATLCIRIAWFTKLALECRQAARRPLFAFEFGNGERRYLVEAASVPESIRAPAAQRDWSLLRSVRVLPADLDPGTVIVTGRWIWLAMAEPDLLRWKENIEANH